MQKIERYGVIALLFLFVTIAAVTLWGEDATAPPDQVAGGSAPKTRAESTPVAGSVSAPSLGTSATQTAKPGLRPGPLPPALSPAQLAGAPALEALPTRAPLRLDAASEKPPALRAYNASEALLAAQTERHAARRGSGPRLAQNRRSRPTHDGSASEMSSETSPAASGITRSVESRRPQGSMASAVPGGRQPSRRPATYSVRSGDSLSVIAQRTLGSSTRWREIQAANGNINPHALVIGSTLKIPGTGRAATRAPDPTATTTAPSTTRTQAPAASTPRSGAVANWTYEVRSGDVLTAIARDHLGSSRRWTEIRDLNPGIDPNRLAVGTRIRIPGAGPRPKVNGGKVNSNAGGRSLAAATPPKDSNRRKPRVR